MRQRMGGIYRFYRPALFFGLAGFGIALALYAYTGTFTRYWADDYCYNATLRVDGFWLGQLRFYQHTSDRYSVIPLVGLSEIFGKQAIRFWPAAALLLALPSLTWLLKQLGRVFGAELSLLECLLLSAIILFFTLWQSPNLFQSFYWRTGMLTYFMPLICLCLLGGLVLRQILAVRASFWELGAVILLSFFAGGFSETTAAMQAGAAGLALVLTIALWWQARRANCQTAAHRSALILLGSALVGTLLAMVALFVSPSNQLRLVHMPEPAGLPTLLRYSFQFGLDFLRDTLSSQPLPTFVSLLAPFALALAWYVRQDRYPNPLRALIFLAGVWTAAYLLVVAVCAPSVYVEVAYPEMRALIAARFAMVLGLAATGWLFGALAMSVSQRLRISAAWVLLGALLLFAAAALYPLRSVRTTLSTDLPYYQQRAAGWDARDQQVRALIAQGQSRLELPALDSIGGLMDLQTDPGRFPNHCFAGAYGLEQVTGLIP